MSLPVVDEETRQAAEDLAAGSLESQTKAIRNKHIAWASYLRANLIRQDEFDMIVAYDRAFDNQDSLLAEKGTQYASLFLSLLQRLTNEETVQYLLTLVDDLLSADTERASLFLPSGDTDPGQACAAVLPLVLHSTDLYAQNKAVKVLSALIVAGCPLDEHDSAKYMKWMSGQLLQGNVITVQTIVRYALMELLHFAWARIAFYKTPEGVDSLCQLLRHRPAHIQMQYQVLFCLWCMTFDSSIATTISCRHHLQPIIASVLSKTNKEKVVRMAVATLKNLLTQAERGNNNAELMVANGLPKILRALQNKSWKDSDLCDDLDFVVAALDDCVQDMSSLDEYMAEIKSGDIKWSAVHRSEAFWRENAMAFNDNNRELLRLLIGQLESSKDAIVLAVCAHDLGEYVSHYSRGRSNVEDLGGKALLVGLMQDRDSSVRYESLVAIQKMMVQNWHFLHRQTDKASK